MYKRILYNFLTVAAFALTVVSLTACQESIEERAVRDAQEFTRKHCPTPPENDVITDSVVFDKTSRTQIYYMTFTGAIDNPQSISDNKDKLRGLLLETILYNTNLKAYKEAGFNFRYVCRSQKENGKILLDIEYTKKDYSK